MKVKIPIISTTNLMVLILAVFVYLFYQKQNPLALPYILMALGLSMGNFYLAIFFINLGYRFFQKQFFGLSLLSMITRLTLLTIIFFLLFKVGFTNFTLFLIWFLVFYAFYFVGEIRYLLKNQGF